MKGFIKFFVAFIWIIAVSTSGGTKYEKPITLITAGYMLFMFIKYFVWPLFSGLVIDLWTFSKKNKKTTYNNYQTNKNANFTVGNYTSHNFYHATSQNDMDSNYESSDNTTKSSNTYSSNKSSMSKELKRAKSNFYDSYGYGDSSDTRWDNYYELKSAASKDLKNGNISRKEYNKLLNDAKDKTL